MTHRAGTGHIGSSFSIAEILAVLYGKILDVDPSNPTAANRDRFILSKGHAAAALYSALAQRGFFPTSWLGTYCLDGGELGGHTSWGVPGIDAATGALGHGLPMGVGIALGVRRADLPNRIFVLVSDGEMDEGTTWEAALFAAHAELDNLVVLLDYNKMQSSGNVPDVLNIEPLGAKWSAFGWTVAEVDGHDEARLVEALLDVPLEKGKPACIICHTVKGKGVSFMEGNLLWHHKATTKDEMARAIAEVG